MGRLHVDRSDPQRDPQTYAIIGAAMAVHSHFGPGFFEYVYQEALAIELEHQSIPHEREPRIELHYRGEILHSHCQPDFICFGEIILELKALDTLESLHQAQVLNYLKATGHRRGLLMNFGEESLQFQRLVFG